MLAEARFFFLSSLHRCNRLATWALSIAFSMMVATILFIATAPIPNDEGINGKVADTIDVQNKNSLRDSHLGLDIAENFYYSLIAPPEDSSLRTGFTAFGSRFYSKFYIYQAEVAPDLYHSLFRSKFCRQQHFAAEITFPEAIFFSDLYTSDPELADFYIVPVQPSCFMSTALQQGISMSNSIQAFNELFNRTLINIMTTRSFWWKTHGRDHIFLFMSEEGLSLISEAIWPLIRKSIFLTAPTRGGVSAAQRFDTYRDIILPVFVPNFVKELTISNERQVKVFFRGIFQGSAIGENTKQMISQAKAYRNVHLTDSEVRSNCINTPVLKCHAEDMTNASFCLVPAGVKGWSKRLSLALMSSCVPVFIMEGQELPFEDLIEWERFSIKVLPTQLGSIIDILEAYPKERFAEKYSHLREFGHSLSLYGVEPGQAFDLALRILDTRKYRFFRNSQSVFWTDNYQTSTPG